MTTHPHRRDEPHLRRQLLQWLLLPLTVLLMLDAGLAWWQAQRAAHLAYDRVLLEMAREIALHARQEGGHLRLALPADASNVLLQDPEDRIFFRVTSTAGQVLGGNAELQPTETHARASAVPSSTAAKVLGEPVRQLSTAMPVQGSLPPQEVQVQVAETLNKRSQLAWALMANALLPQLVLVLLAAAVVWVGVARGLAPLQRLRDAVSSRSHVDLSPLATHDVPGEVRPLVDEVNQLMERLGRTIEFQNRFVADAAHQLKTPVSGLKAQIELALRETDPQRLQHSMAQLYISADRLSRLVQQLLALARNEPGALAALQLIPLDLHALALEVSMEWVPLALKRNIDLGFEGQGQALMVNGDPDRLRELLNNLIDNAILYSQAGGRVTVRAAASHRGWQLADRFATTA